MRIIDTEEGYRLDHPDAGLLTLTGRLGFINHRLNSTERLRKERNKAEAELAEVKRQLEDALENCELLIKANQELVSKSENSI